MATVETIRLFLSYRFVDEAFVSMVYRYLCSQAPEIEPYFYSRQRGAGRWSKEVREAFAQSNGFVLFVGEELGEVQRDEMGSALLDARKQDRLLWVKLVPQTTAEAARFTAERDPVDLVRGHRPAAPGPELGDAEAHDCALEITRRLGVVWREPDDVPVDYLFDYEKGIVEAFRRQRGQRLDPRIPASWPQVPKTRADRPNPLLPESIGDYRPEEARVIVDARSGSVDHDFTLPEAGPRQRLCYPSPRSPKRLDIGVLVSGGIAPGVNAVIAGIVNRHYLYARPPGVAAERGYHVHIRGYLEGFKALLRKGDHYLKLDPAIVQDRAQLGGSMLGTARVDELLDPSPARRLKATEDIVTKLEKDGIEILYVIGGDGSMRAAHAIWTIAHQRDSNLSVVAIPKTMDNDILWVWQSFGFLSAVEKAKEIIVQLQTEAYSNPRLCVIQLFGSDSGFVVAHAVLASGACDYALIPEAKFTMKTLVRRMKELLARRLEEDKDQRAHGMIVMSETAIPRDALDYLDVAGLDHVEEQKLREFLAKPRVRGQTADELRSAGLKIVSRVLEDEIRKLDVDPEYFKKFRVFTNQPRHIIRAISPSVSDVILGQRLGVLAVDNALAGYSDFMVSQWLTEFVLVPLKLVVLGRKRVPRPGIFWKSVLASTGQPEEDLPD